MKIYKNQEKRDLNEKFRKYFDVWRRALDEHKTRDIKTKIIFKLKTFIENGNRKKLLAKWI